jgi:hypothetical protein
MAASQLGYTPGSGANVATDQDGGGAHHQKALIEHLQSGVPAPVSETYPLPIRSQSLDVLRRIAALLKPLQQITGGGSNRLSLDVNNIAGGTVTTVSTVTTVTTVTTCSTVSNVAASTLTNVANVWAFDQAKAMSRQAYNSGIRARI